MNYHLRQHQVEYKSPFAANAVLPRPATRFTYPYKYLVNTGVEETSAYGFSIKKSYSLTPNYRAVLTGNNSADLLQSYLYRYRVYYADQLRNRQWTDPSEGFLWDVIGSFVVPNLRPLPPGVTPR